MRSVRNCDSYMHSSQTFRCIHLSACYSILCNPLEHSLSSGVSRIPCPPLKIVRPDNLSYIALRDIVSYAVICRVCPRHGMQIHIQTCTCADRYTYSYLDMSMSSAVCRWVLLGLSIGCVPHPYRERHFCP